jgi:hypothetical protein
MRKGQALFVRSDQAAVVAGKILAARDQKSVRFEKFGDRQSLGRADLDTGDPPRRKQVFQLRYDDTVVGQSVGSGVEGGGRFVVGDLGI